MSARASKGKGAGAGRPASQPSQDAAPAWKKGGGGALSAKAKKEYLQWKRAQKREKADGDSDSDWGNEETPSTSAPAPAAAAAPRAADARAKPLNQETAESGSGGSDEELVPSTSRPDPRVKPSTGRQGTAQEQQEQQQHSTRTKQSVSALPDSKAGLSSDSGLDDGNGDDESRDHRDEDVNVRMTAGAARPNKGTRKGAAYQARLAAQETHALALAQATKGDSAARYTSCDDPLQYVHMEEMPEGDVPPGVKDVYPSGHVRLARVCAGEVGFSPLGLSLGMPKRPSWRGKVRNADELHALEERCFREWMDGLQARAGDGARVSFFETRLEFWRQLWRVLERSDVALMLADARCPLLHFSEALTRHVVEERGMAALLVLNKADLVPAAAAQQWMQWFEERYPGLKVITSSASLDGGKAAAEAIVDAILACKVQASGHTNSINNNAQVPIGEILGQGRDEILQESRARNIHSKRDKPQIPSSVAGAVKDATQAGKDVPLASETMGSSDDEEEEQDVGKGWALKGTKARKKQAVKKKRDRRMTAAAQQQQQHHHHHQAGHTHQEEDEEVPVASSSGRAGASASAGAGAGASTQGRDRGRDASTERGLSRLGRPGSSASAARPSSGYSSQDAYDLDFGEDEEAGAMDTDRLFSDEEYQEASGSENDNALFDELGDDDEQAAFEQEDEKAEGEDAGDGQAHASSSGAGQPAGPGAGRSQARLATHAKAPIRPIVVCVVGEPNVGKSSTMNALLGAHRVAVSSHPGRTKHYQTHLLTSRLMLCDCPGLVFPRADVSLPLQVLFGSFPIARVRNPYEVVKYLAERLWPPLHATLRLQHLVTDANGDLQLPRGAQVDAQAACDQPWTAMTLCESLAAKHSWRSRKGGRLDTYRAANWLLRSALAGRNGVDLALLPPLDAPPLQAAVQALSKE